MSEPTPPPPARPPCEVCGAVPPRADYSGLGGVIGGRHFVVCSPCMTAGALWAARQAREASQGSAVGFFRYREDGSVELCDPCGVVLGVLRRGGWMPADPVKPDAEVAP